MFFFFPHLKPRAKIKKAKDQGPAPDPGGNGPRDQAFRRFGQPGNCGSSESVVGTALSLTQALHVQYIYPHGFVCFWGASWIRLVSKRKHEDNNNFGSPNL